jgi:hypothetical protein
MRMAMRPHIERESPARRLEDGSIVPGPEDAAAIVRVLLVTAAALLALTVGTLALFG